jgi:hypothetical protein
MERSRYGDYYAIATCCCLMLAGCTAQVLSPNAVATRTGTCTAPMVAASCSSDGNDISSDPTPNTRRNTDLTTSDSKQVNFGGLSTNETEPVPSAGDKPSP